MKKRSRVTLKKQFLKSRQVMARIMFKDKQEVDLVDATPNKSEYSKRDYPKGLPQRGMKFDQKGLDK